MDITLVHIPNPLTLAEREIYNLHPDEAVSVNALLEQAGVVLSQPHICFVDGMLTDFETLVADGAIVVIRARVDVAALPAVALGIIGYSGYRALSGTSSLSLAPSVAVSDVFAGDPMVVPSTSTEFDNISTPYQRPLPKTFETIRPIGVMTGPDFSGYSGARAAQSAYVRNTARPYAPMPLIIGRHRFAPDISIYPSTSYDTNTEADGTIKNTVYQALNFGVQPMVITDLRMGDTPIGMFKNVFMERPNSDGTLGTNFLPVEQEKGGRLEYKKDALFYESSDGVFLIEVELLFFAYNFNKYTGKITPDTINLLIEYRLKSSQNWSTFPNTTLRGGSHIARRMTFSMEAPSGGEYYVRVSKQTPDFNGPDRYNQASVTAVKFVHKDGSDYSNQTRIGLVYSSAVAQTGGTDTFNAVCFSPIPVRQPNTDVEVLHPTSNPAWWFLWFLRGARDSKTSKLMYGCGLSDARIDLQSIVAWAAFCDKNDLTVNTVITTAISRREVLELIAHCGRAEMTLHTGKYGVIWDTPDSPIVAVFDADTIRAGSFTVQYAANRPHDAVTVDFINADKGWKHDSVTVKLSDAPDARITNALRTSLAGCTNGALAARQAKRIAANRVYLRTRITWESDIEGFICTKGDLVKISNNLLPSSIGAPRVFRIVGVQPLSGLCFKFTAVEYSADYYAAESIAGNVLGYDTPTDLARAKIYRNLTKEDPSIKYIAWRFTVDSTLDVFWHTAGGCSYDVSATSGEFFDSVVGTYANRTTFFGIRRGRYDVVVKKTCDGGAISDRAITISNTNVDGKVDAPVVDVVPTSTGVVLYLISYAQGHTAWSCDVYVGTSYKSVFNKNVSDDVQVVELADSRDILMQVSTTSASGATSNYFFIRADKLTSVGGVVAQNVTVRVSGNNATPRVFLSWLPISGADSYVVTIKNTLTDSVIKKTVYDTDAEFDVDAGDYTWSVVAVMNGGLTGFEASGSFSAGQQLATPAAVNIKAIGGVNVVHLSWDFPQDTAGLSSTVIEASWVEDDAGAQNQIFNIPYPATTFDHVGLPDITRVNYVVYGLNRFGVKSAAAAISATTISSVPLLLDKLKGQLGTDSLNAELATRIGQVSDGMRGEIDARADKIIADTARELDNIRDSLQDEVEARLAQAAQLRKDFKEIAETSGGNKVFSQSTAPTVGMSLGDIWFDTDDDKIYRYDVRGWTPAAQTSVDANAAAIIKEVQDRIAAVAAVDSKVESVKSELGAAKANYDNKIFTLIDADKTITSKVTTLSAKLDGEIAKTAGYKAAIDILVTTDKTTASKISSLTSQLSDANAAIKTNASAITNTNQALTQQVTDVRADFAKQVAGFETQIRATADSVSAQTAKTETAIAKLDSGIEARIQTSAGIWGGTIQGLQAQYTVKLDVDGYVSGFGLASGGSQGASSAFRIRADRFSIEAPLPVAKTTAQKDALRAAANKTVKMDDGYTVYIKVAAPDPINVKLGDFWYSPDRLGAKYYRRTVSGWTVIRRTDVPAAALAVIDKFESDIRAGIDLAPVANAPFIYQATDTFEGGVHIPAGVYINDAYIKTLNANKIKAGSITVDRLQTDWRANVFGQTLAERNPNAVESIPNHRTYIVKSADKLILNSRSRYVIVAVNGAGGFDKDLDDIKSKYLLPSKLKIGGITVVQSATPSASWSISSASSVSPASGFFDFESAVKEYKLDVLDFEVAAALLGVSYRHIAAAMMSGARDLTDFDAASRFGTKQATYPAYLANMIDAGWGLLFAVSAAQKYTTPENIITALRHDGDRGWLFPRIGYNVVQTGDRDTEISITYGRGGGSYYYGAHGFVIIQQVF